MGGGGGGGGGGKTVNERGTVSLNKKCLSSVL